MQQKNKRHNCEFRMQQANKTRSNLLSILLFFIILTTLVPAAGIAGQKLQLFYSNDVRSELEACG
jgi:hypothetical protein